ncbi:MAG TPA: wax ester/triacylglycerol synthase family O-acyltransferase [Mycobacteriales bacterium]|nr:wax ester/triacylglycerol synthase family O-acyltransferase [Mycobacteriales bacterium]
MQQLTGLDANFLYLEAGATFGHVCGVALLDPTTRPDPLTLEVVQTVVAQRLHLLPPLRRRLVEVPFGIDRPYWAEDPDFDLDFHVREVALPSPGTSHQLAEQVARIAARPLDRARPLWELYLIEGLEQGRAALMVKFHHAAIDGVAGAELLTTLLDQTPEPPDPAAPPVPFRAAPIPGELQMWARGVLGLTLQPLKLLDYQWRLLRTLPRSARLVARTTGPALAETAARWSRGGPLADGGVLSWPGVGAPSTSFNRAITPHRRWAYTSASLDAVKAVKNAFGVTVNDVVMAACAAGLRQWLQVHHELPAQPLLAMVPISIRTDQQRGSFGNRVAALVATLPTHLDDPVARLRAAHEAMRVAKEQHAAIGAETLQDVTQFALPALATRAARVAAQLRIADVVNPPYNVVISNVPGPRTPLYFAGTRLLGYYPVSVVADGQGLNITVQSYLDNLDIGLISCRELVPDLWDLLGYITNAFDELAELARAEAR